MALRGINMFIIKNNYSKININFTLLLSLALGFILCFSEVCQANDYNKTLRKYKKELKKRVKKYGAESTAVARSYSDIASIYLKQKKYEITLEYYQKAAYIFQNKEGKQHIHVAHSFANIAKTYAEMRNKKGLEYYKKSLQIYEENYGKTSPRLIIPYTEIVNYHARMGDYKKALSVLDIESKILSTAGPRHIVKTGKLYRHYGWVYKLKGDKKKAVSYYKKALSTFKSSVGEEHPYYWLTQDLLKKEML